MPQVKAAEADKKKDKTSSEIGARPDLGCAVRLLPPGGAGRRAEPRRSADAEAFLFVVGAKQAGKTALLRHLLRLEQACARRIAGPVRGGRARRGWQLG